MFVMCVMCHGVYTCDVCDVCSVSTIRGKPGIHWATSCRLVACNSNEYG